MATLIVPGITPTRPSDGMFGITSNTLAFSCLSGSITFRLAATWSEELLVQCWDWAAGVWLPRQRCSKSSLGWIHSYVTVMVPSVRSWSSHASPQVTVSVLFDRPRARRLIGGLESETPCYWVGGQSRQTNGCYELVIQGQCVTISREFRTFCWGRILSWSNNNPVTGFFSR